MTRDDKEALREFARGATFVIVVMGVIALFVGIFGTLDKTPPQDKFKVVDTYNGCNVVRYTDETQRWQYFLDCSTVR